MPTSPLLEFAIEIKHKEDIAKVTADLANQEATVSRLNQRLAAGVINQNLYNQAMVNIGAMAQKSSAQLHSLEHASGSAGRGLSQLAYAIDDIQYGFNAIVNNIPQIVMGMGLGVGVAGAAGIAAVAINQLTKHSGDLADLWNSWTSDKPIATLTAMRERADEAATAFERLKKAQPDAQGKSIAGIEKTIVEAGVPNAVADLAGAIAGDVILGATRKIARGTPDQNLGRGEIIPGISKEKQQAEFDAKKVDEDRKTAERLLGRATSKDEAERRAALEDIGRLNPELGRKLEEQTPEAQAQKAAKEQDAAELKKWLEDIHKIRKEANEEDIREAKHWRDDITRIRKERLEGDKRGRIQALEDQHDAIEKQRKKALDQLGGQGQSQIIGGGAKGAIDYYQTNVNSGDREKLALMKKFDKQLEAIKDAVKKERRLVLGG